MKSMVITGICMMLFLTFSCSKDSTPGSEEERVVLPDFRLIGENAEGVYQYTYDSSTESGAEVNLTPTLGVRPGYLTLRQVDEVVSFYSFSTGNFSLLQQNTSTGQSASYPNFYSVSDERSIIWGANSEDLIFLGYYSPWGSRNFGIRILDPFDASFMDLPLETDIQQAFDPLYYRQRLLITYRAGNGAYKLAIFNTETREVIQALDFGTGIPNVLIDGEGNIGILLGLGNAQFIYRTLDFETLEQISESNLTLNEFFPAGPLQGSVYGTTLYYTNFLVQPSVVPFGPAHFDLAKSENVEIDIIRIIQEVEAEMEINIDLTTLRYFDYGEVFLVGYARVSADTSREGGVLGISKTGQLQDRIVLPFVPTYFLRP